jgi:FtsH-binding integral membrane protein
MELNPIVEKILVAITFGIIAYLVILFVISTGMILLILATIGLAVFGAYTLWETYAKNELLKKEENFDTLKEKQ